MAYFLFLWNPAKDTLFPTFIDSFSSGARKECRWSCGNATGIVAGDHALLRRTGPDLKGIVGIGTVIEGSFKESPISPGGSGNFVRISWEHLANEPFVTAHDPSLGRLPRVWTAQAGGTRIRDADGRAIVGAVQDRIAMTSPMTGPHFAEGAVVQRLMKVRERCATVREHCLAAHGAVCAICSFDPGNELGQEFLDLMEVHHLYPVANHNEERITDPEKDCVPLCPTCHRLAHYKMPRGKCRTIEQLRTMVSKARLR